MELSVLLMSSASALLPDLLNYTHNLDSSC